MPAPDEIDPQTPDTPEAPPPALTQEAIAAMITGAVKRQTKALEAKIAELAAKAAEKPEDEAPKGKADPAKSALEKQVEELAKRLADADKRAQAAEEKQRAEGARAALRSALSEHVRPELLDTATKLLYDADRRVTFDEDGTPLFVVKHASMGGAPEDTPFPLADGVKHWLKTPEAKFFQPAPGGEAPKSGGPAPKYRGNGMPKYDTPAKTDAEKARRAMEMSQALAGRLPNL
jgi:hypothetical protein